VGTKSRFSRYFWPSGLISKSYQSTAAFGCGACAAAPTPFGRAMAGPIENQSMGAPFFFSCSAL